MRRGKGSGEGGREGRVKVRRKGWLEAGRCTKAETKFMSVA